MLLYERFPRPVFRYRTSACQNLPCCWKERSNDCQGHNSYTQLATRSEACNGIGMLQSTVQCNCPHCLAAMPRKNSFSFLRVGHAMTRIRQSTMGCFALAPFGELSTSNSGVLEPSMTLSDYLLWPLRLLLPLEFRPDSRRETYAQEGISMVRAEVEALPSMRQVDHNAGIKKYWRFQVNSQHEWQGPIREAD